MKSLIAAVAFATTLGNVSSTFAQVYPSHPVAIVVPFAAGGPTDVIARTMAGQMRASLRQAVIIENVTGANGNIGHWSTHVVNIFPREQQTPEALGTFHKAEIEKWWPIIRAAAIRVE